MKALKRSAASSSSSVAGPSSSSSSAVAVASSPPSSSSSSWIHLRSLLIVSSHPVPDRSSLKSPWSRRKRKHILSRRRWETLFSSEGKFLDGGVKFLRKVRSGGVDPSIRADVWPFLLGVYDLKSSEAERTVIRTQKRKEYEKLRKKCQQLQNEKRNGLKAIDESNGEEDILNFSDDPRYNDSEDDACARPSMFNGEQSLYDDNCDDLFRDGKFASNFSSMDAEEEEEGSWYGFTHVDLSPLESESSDSETSGDDEHESLLSSSMRVETAEPDPKFLKNPSVRVDFYESNRTPEDFVTWQRIIRLDAIRANTDWMVYYPAQEVISKEVAIETAACVGLKNYDHLEPRMIYHAARLVAVLEAYAVYDPETGYCQGMSDLLSPILCVIEEDYEAFWCFVGFMKKARHNFRLDESGIKRQLNIVSKIIKCKDSHLYRHLEKLQAEDCCFVYRMVVVLFRRELTFEQTVSLWEVMWADQAAIRAGIGKSAWGRIRLRAPPTDDLLLYAIAACVLQRRKLIIEKYNSIDEILRECNSMAGQLDVWRLLDDAHDLVVNLHEKI